VRNQFGRLDSLEIGFEISSLIIPFFFVSSNFIKLFFLGEPMTMPFEQRVKVKVALSQTQKRY